MDAMGKISDPSYGNTRQPPTNTFFVFFFAKRPSVASAESNDDLIALLKLVISAATLGWCFMLNFF